MTVGESFASVPWKPVSKGAYLRHIGKKIQSLRIRHGSARMSTDPWIDPPHVPEARQEGSPARREAEHRSCFVSVSGALEERRERSAQGSRHPSGVPGSLSHEVRRFRSASPPATFLSPLRAYITWTGFPIPLGTFSCDLSENPPSGRRREGRFRVFGCFTKLTYLV